MDTQQDDTVKRKVEEQLQVIKSSMPATYRAIQAKAQEIGAKAYGLVRRAAGGEAGCFWACERGHVVGTPIGDVELERDVALLLLQFGSAHVCMWGRAALAGGGDGSR